MYRFGNKLTALAAVCAVMAPGWLLAPALAQTNAGSAEVMALSPEQVAVQQELKFSGQGMEAVAAFYAARNWEPLWTGLQRQQYGDALVAALADAGLHGLPAARYAGIEAHLDAGALSQGAQAEIAASMAYLAYAQDVHSGLLDPAAISEELAIRPPRQSVTDLLARVVAADSGADLMQGLVPTSPNYARLLKEKSSLELQLQTDVATDMIAEGDIIRPGDTDPRVAQMRARLGAVGFSAGLGTSPVYDEALVGLVKLFQESNGLSADGAVGPRTVAVMNRSSRDQLQQVLVNLERERWLNIPRGNRHILVNIAAFVAQVYDDGVPVFETRTVVGSGQHHTPEFSDEMTHMVVNPSWHVPVSIIGKEYLPQLQRNNTAMNQQGIQIFYKGRQIDPTLVDFTQFTAGNFPVTMRQPPGAGNALGKVKFLFPNKFDIYLHDTPSKSLFQKSQRDFSHGCVRVQRPMDLAYLLLSRQSDDPEGLFQRTLDTGRETTLNLDVPVPVHLTYLTVWQDETGATQYLADVYGRDQLVYAALEAAGAGIALPES